MAQKIEEARVRQKSDTLENWNNNDLPLLDGEQAFIRSDVDDMNIGFKLGSKNKKFSELPYPDYSVRGKVSPSSTWVGRQSGVYIPTLNGTYNGITVNLGEGYQVLYWDGTTLEKVVYPADFTGLVFGGVIDDSADLSNPTEAIWYIASPGTYNTVPPITLTEQSILTWNGTEWSHIPFELEISGNTLIADNVSEIRNMPAQVQQLIFDGTYKIVSLLGYYSKGDTPYPINFNISNNSFVDDNSTFFILSNIKLEVQEKDLDLKHFGGVSDGNEVSFTGTDNKVFIDRAVAYCSRVKGNLNINGKYYHSPLIINKSDFSINMSNGTKLISNLPDAQDKSLRINGGASNITINAYGAEFIALNTYTSGEFRHIITITHASNINIFGLKATGGGGDGFYIGNDVENSLPYRVFLHDCIADGNRRNGISVINGETIHLYNTLAQNINGTSPQAGIDIEPNSKSFEILKDCKVINPTTKNCGTVGVLVNVANYVNEIDKTVDISISNHTSIGDGQGYGINGKGGEFPWNNKLSGTITYSGNIFSPLGNGIAIVDYDVTKAPFLDIDAYIENAGNSPASTSTSQNPLFIYAGGGSTFDVGNINAKIRVRDTRATPKNYADVYLSNQNKSILNYNIEVDSDNRRTFTYGVFNSSLQNAKGVIKYIKKPVYDISTSQSLGNAVRGTGGIFNATASLSVSLPSCIGYEGNIYQVNCSIANAVVITPISGEYIIIDGAKVTSLTLSKVGQYLELKATVNGWEILNNNFDKSSVTGSRPTVAQGVLYWYDSTLNRAIFWNGTAWVDVTSPNATTSLKGVVNQGVAVPNGSSIDTLLASLRTAGILAT